MKHSCQQQTYEQKDKTLVSTTDLWAERWNINNRPMSNSHFVDYVGGGVQNGSNQHHCGSVDNSPGVASCVVIEIVLWLVFFISNLVITWFMVYYLLVSPSLPSLLTSIDPLSPPCVVSRPDATSPIVTMNTESHCCVLSFLPRNIRESTWIGLKLIAKISVKYCNLKIYWEIQSFYETKWSPNYNDIIHVDIDIYYYYWS